MTKSVSTLLAERRDEIVERWADLLHSMEGTSYFARPREELRVIYGRCFSAILRALSDGSYAQVREFIDEISPVLAAEGFRLSEVQRGLLNLKEVVWPLLAEKYQGDVLGFMNAGRQIDTCLNATIFEFSEVYQSQVNNGVNSYLREIEEINRKLQQLAIHDGLTGLYNHRYFDDRLRLEMQRAERYKRPTTLLMLDLDRFKLVNDRYGHPVGDQVLKEVAEIIRRRIREVDIAARYGGEEFVVILPETARENAAVVAERIRKSVEDARFAADGQEAKITISIGVADFPTDAHDHDKLVEAADKALYQAKQEGRNRVALAG